jgi:hypothetical protein
VPRGSRHHSRCGTEIAGLGHIEARGVAPDVWGNRAEVVFVMPIYAANRRDTH